MQLNNLFKRSKPEEPETKAPEAEQAAPVSTKTCPRCQAELTTAELEAQEKRLERTLEAEKKAVADAIHSTIRRRNEEICSSYDKEIAKGQERLKKIRSKREMSIDLALSSSLGFGGHNGCIAFKRAEG